MNLQYIKGKIMKNYSLKMLGNQNDFFTIISQNNDGYNIKISRNIDGKETETLDFISKEVFDFSLKTGYLTEVKKTETASA